MQVKSHAASTPSWARRSGPQDGNRRVGERLRPPCNSLIYVIDNSNY